MMCGCIIWLTGLSGSGKSTLAQAVGEKLSRDGFSFTIIDGDDVRASQLIMTAREPWFAEAQE